MGCFAAIAGEVFLPATHLRCQLLPLHGENSSQVKEGDFLMFFLSKKEVCADEVGNCKYSSDFRSKSVTGT